MPLWKIRHPAGACTAEEKKRFAGAITQVCEAVPIPRF
jgi:phenylpyruvate tautomerase PptA (4-oxalocrotonate tautomerase family)